MLMNLLSLCTIVKIGSTKYNMLDTPTNIVIEIVLEVKGT